VNSVSFNSSSPQPAIEALVLAAIAVALARKVKGAAGGAH